MQKARGKRTHPKHPAHHAKSLHGRPRVRMQLGWGHIKFPKDSSRKSIKGKGHMEYIKKKGGSIDDRSLYTPSSKEQGPKANRDSPAEAFKTGTSFKNSATEASV